MTSRYQSQKRIAARRRRKAQMLFRQSCDLYLGYAMNATRELLHAQWDLGKMLSPYQLIERVYHPDVWNSYTSNTQGILLWEMLEYD